MSNETDDLPIEIIRGRSKAIDVFLRDENDLPIDITSLTEMVASVKAATGSPVQTKLSDGDIVVVGSPLLGHAQVKISGAKSSLYATTGHDPSTNPNYSTLQLSMTITGNPDFNPGIKLINDALNIIDPLS